MVRALTVNQIHVTTVGGAVSWGRPGNEGEATLFMDFDEDAFYVDMERTIGYHAEQSMLFLIDQLGFELMEEFECPAEQQSDGRMRFWLARKFQNIVPLRAV